MGGIRRTEARLIEYSPLPSQRRFHESQARFKGFSGPIGSGKSQALCHEAVKLSYLNPGRAGLIGAPTYPMLRDATQRTLLEVLQKNRLPYELNKSENTLVMLDTRSKILFRAVDEFERLRGTNLAWFGIDELTYAPEEAWLRLEGRLRDSRAGRLCGFAVWTPKGFDWVYKRFKSEQVPGYDLIEARPFENLHVLEAVPDFYQRLRGSYTELFYRQEVLGEYLNIAAGQVYSAFDRNTHMAPNELDPAVPLLWALDFNVEPMSSLIVQIRGVDIRVLDEIVISRGTTQHACEEFYNRYAKKAWKVVVYGDASGARMHTVGSNDYQVIRDYFRQAGLPPLDLRVPSANPNVRDRVLLTNSKLRAADGTVHMTIDPRCRELIKDLEQVTYKPGTYVIDKDGDNSRTHLSDALGYLLWQECGPRPPIGEQQHRLF
jgi:hypothetical protein